MKNRLKVLRAENNWTQQDIAKQLNISRQTISAIEKNKYNPSLGLAFKIAHLFKCKIEDIFIFEE
ncbi:MAG: helix-turn-helix transcriptional regulator [Candidatus Thorarchaeota archaeon]